MATRSERRDNTESAIIDAGLQLLAEGGAEALTIRGLARKLVLVPSALYRYVRNREGEKNNGIYIELELKGLATLGRKSGELLERAILGYTR